MEQEASSSVPNDISAAVWHHGVFMLLAWVFFIPISISSFRLLRSNDGNSSLLFFRVHYLMAAMGILLAVAGFVIGGRSFHTTAPLSSKALLHSLLGSVTMYASMAIVLAYPCMGKPLESRSVTQTWVAAVHRYTGYVLVLLAWVTCYLGTQITWVYQARLERVGAGCFCALLLGTLGLAVSSRSPSSDLRVSSMPTGEQQRLLP